MTRVFSGEATFLAPVLRPVESVLYRFAGVDPQRENSTGSPIRWP
jgi:K+-transporting ATPase ATPase A chain